MSQAGLLDVIASHPEIPTSFPTNSGTAVPLDNVLEILGNGTIQTTGVDNIVTIELTGLTNHNVLVGAGTTTVGLIDPSTSGYVLTSNGGSADPTFQAVSASGAITQIDGDSGSMTPTAGVVTISGGSTGLTTSASASTMDLTGTLIVGNGGTGDTSFTVYAPICGGTTSAGNLQSADSGISNSGYVLTSTGASSIPTWQAAASGGITTIDGNTGSATGSTVSIVVPTDNGTWSFDASGSTVTLNTTLADRNTVIGDLAGYNLSGANDNTGFGYQCLRNAGTVGGCTGVGSGALFAVTTGAANTAVGNNACGQVADGTDNTAVGAGALSGGSSSSMGFHSVLGSNALGQLTTGNRNCCIGYAAGYDYNSSESDNILIGYQVYGTLGESNVLRIGKGTGTSDGELNLAYIQGITGSTPVSGNTPQVVLCDNAGNLTVIDSSTSGYVLTSNGASTPSFQAAASGGFTSVVVQEFTSSGTYTPTAGMVYCTIEVVGGGGGGGGSGAGSASTGAVGSGGGGGGYSRKTVAAATIGASQSVTIASAASGGTGAAAGSNGGTCSVGSIVSATGGTGGATGAAATTTGAAGSAGGAGSSGDININGGPGGNGLYVLITGVAQICTGGTGGNSYFGGGATPVATVSGAASSNGNAGSAYGGGGGGAITASSGSAANGGAGSTGVVIITEYVA